MNTLTFLQKKVWNPKKVESKVTTKIIQKISLLCFQLMQTIFIYQFNIPAKRRWKRKWINIRIHPIICKSMLNIIHLYNTSYSLVDAFLFYNFHKMIEALQPISVYIFRSGYFIDVVIFLLFIIFTNVTSFLFTNVVSLKIWYIKMLSFTCILKYHATMILF